MKRFVAAALAVLMSFSVFSGCAGKADAPEKGGSSAPQSTAAEKIPIRFMYWNKEESMQALIGLIRQKLPNVDFQYQYVDTASYQTVYKTQMNAGEGPEILSIEKVPTEVRAGYCLDLTDQPFMKDYQESVLNELAVDGRYYCIPGPSWFGGYFYNKGMFDEHGWKIPKTYDEWLQLCDKIAASGIKPLANPIKNPNYLMHYAVGFLEGDFLRQPKGMNWDKDYAAGKTTMASTWGPYLEEWAKVVKKGYVKPEDLGMDYDQALDEFATGKAAMFDSGPWDVETIYSKNAKIKIDMMPYVGNSGDTGWLFGGPGIRFGVNKKLGEAGNEKKLAAALQVLELISSPEGQLAYWQNNQGGSSYVKGVKFEMGKEYAGCAEVFEKGHIYAPFQQWNSGVYEEFGKQLQGYVAGDTTLKEVMAATDAKNKEVMEKLG